MSLIVDFWDVGQGDCSVVRLPGNELLVIDVGPRNSPIIEWLDARPAERVHTIVLTHNDEDHAGCFPAVIDQLGARLKNVFLLEDRHMNRQNTRRIVDCVNRWAKMTGGICHRLETRPGELLDVYSETDSEIGKLSLKAVHPSPIVSIENQTKAHPDHNIVSGILHLEINGDVKIIWGGDAPMKTVAATCCGTRPTVMVGPHHGGPTDRKEKGHERHYEALHPECVFVSAGTKNHHGHPIPRFIDLHNALGRRIVCSQLVHCDRLRVEHRRSVLNNHLILGLVPPPGNRGVTCRGPMRFTWDVAQGEFLPDEFHVKHLDALKNVDQPRCIGGRKGG